MKLDFKIVDVSNISDSLKVEMFRLMERHYSNMVWQDFITDLSEKDCVIMLYSQESELVGFSTQLVIVPGDDSQFNDCIVLFSGDTIIAQEYWGSIALPVAFLKLVYSINEKHPGKTLYWMLITKGLRTYKYLSVFFKEYYPCHFAQTPAFVSGLMEYMGKRKFGNAYNHTIGIIEASNESQFLMDSFQPDAKSNAVADFFYKSNSGFSRGNQLLCMAEVSDSNLHPFIKRAVKNYV